MTQFNKNPSIILFNRRQNIIYWMGKNREKICPLFFALMLFLGKLGNTSPVDLIEMKPILISGICWILFIFGAFMRLWASGYIKKNSSIIMTGPYRIVRHPLYLGNISVYLGFFLAAGNIPLGLFLYAVMISIVFYPKMIREEKKLANNFGLTFDQYKAKAPMIIPNLKGISQAFRDKGFSFERAKKNHGLNILWIVLIPIVLKIIIFLNRSYLWPFFLHYGIKWGT